MTGISLTGVTRGAAGTTGKEWAIGTPIIQCSGWAWTELENPITLLRNKTYYITLSSYANMNDPWRFGSWNNSYGRMWPRSPYSENIPDYIDGSGNSNVNNTFAKYSARVYSRTQASGTGFQSINSLPDENTNYETGWPVVNLSLIHI